MAISNVNNEKKIYFISNVVDQRVPNIFLPGPVIFMLLLCDPLKEF